jgi:hypothetical protein
VRTSTESTCLNKFWTIRLSVRVAESRKAALTFAIPIPNSGNPKIHPTKANYVQFFSLV